MVPEIIAAVDMTLIVDGNNGEELVEKMHRHLVIGGTDVRFEDDKFSIRVLGSESSKNKKKSKS